jgi:hypothetical protein
LRDIEGLAVFDNEGKYHVIQKQDEDNKTQRVKEESPPQKSAKFYQK